MDNINNKFNQAIHELHNLESELQKNHELQDNSDNAFETMNYIGELQKMIDLLESMRAEYARRFMG